MSKDYLKEALNEAEVYKNILSENATAITLSSLSEDLNNNINEIADEDEENEYEEVSTDGEDLSVDAEMGDTESEDSSEDTDVDSDEDIDFEDDVEGDEMSTDDESELDIEDSVDDTMGIGGNDDVVIDMTNSDDDELIKVFKKLSDEDEIQVVDGGVEITDPESGNEYKVEMGDETESTDEDFENFGSLEETFGLSDDEENLEEEITDPKKAQAIAREKLRQRLASGEAKLDISDKSKEMANQPKPSFEMDEDNEVIFEIELDDNEIELDEQIPVGSAQAKRKPAGPALDAGIGGAGAYAELKENYKELLKVARELVKENEEQREAINVIKTKIQESKVYTKNLTAITKIFLEHSTTKAEKEAIIEKFNNVKTIDESVKVEKEIISSLNTKTTVLENISESINVNLTSSTSKETINESKNVDPKLDRMKQLMG